MPKFEPKIPSFDVMLGVNSYVRFQSLICIGWNSTILQAPKVGLFWPKNSLLWRNVGVNSFSGQNSPTFGVCKIVKFHPGHLSDVCFHLIACNHMETRLKNELTPVWLQTTTKCLNENGNKSLKQIWRFGLTQHLSESLVLVQFPGKVVAVLDDILDWIHVSRWNNGIYIPKQIQISKPKMNVPLSHQAPQFA